MPKKYLVLENGSVFAGESFGSCRGAAAEIVFNTNMVGYTELLTDPNYEGDHDVIKDGYFNESGDGLRSAPYFDLQIDGITLLDTAF